MTVDFTIVSTVSAILVIFTWSTILASYIAYRKTRPDLHAQSRYKMLQGGLPAEKRLSLHSLPSPRPDTCLALH